MTFSMVAFFSGELRPGVSKMATAENKATKVHYLILTPCPMDVPKIAETVGSKTAAFIY